MLAFLLALIIGIALWWAVTLHTDASLEHLKQTGFQVSYTLEGSPPVVFDDAHKKIAFIRLNRVLVYDYGQVLKWEWGSSEQSGWSDKSETTENIHLTFYLKDDQNPVIRIEGFDEAEAKRWRSQLAALLSKASNQP